MRDKDKDVEFFLVKTKESVPGIWLWERNNPKNG
jgi:hypothetical protein